MRGWKMVWAAAGLAALACAAEPEPSESQIEEVIQRFAAKETEFSLARQNYTYRQTSRIQEVDEFGNARGKWEMVTDILFSGGKRIERVVHAPVATLRNILLTPEDLQDLRDVQPFVLTSKELPEYWVRYLGRQNADEIPCYVFAVKPRQLVEGKRYFQGMVWVDDRDLQIVKTYGRSTGVRKRGENQAFPKFETYREQIDGKFWFPTYTFSDDTLIFPNLAQRIRMVVRYEDYKQFKSESEIKYGDEVPAKETKTP